MTLQLKLQSNIVLAQLLPNFTVYVSPKVKDSGVVVISTPMCQNKKKTNYIHLEEIMMEVIIYFH